MDSQILIDNQLKVRRIKTTRVLALVGMILSATYLFEGIFSAVFALIPTTPFFAVVGIAFWIFFTVIEVLLAASALTLTIIAFVRMIKHAREIEEMPDSPERLEAEAVFKITRIFACIGFFATCATFLFLSLLNIIEFIFVLF